MKLKALFEGPPPVFDPKEMPTFSSSSLGRFYSNRTIESDFNKIGTFNLDDDQYFIIISKETDFACIIKIGERVEDKTIGGYIIAQADFKEPINITFDRSIKYEPSKVIQIDGVEVYQKNLKKRSLGFYFYLGLIKAGYVVISDNYQYIGGKELWKKIIKMSEYDFGFSVYLIDNGHPRLDSDGNPIKIKSKDIENEQEFWSDVKGNKFHTLFLARKD